MHRILIGIAGILVILGIAFALSTDRRAIRLRVVGAAFALQAVIATIVLYWGPGRAALAGASAGVSALLGYSQKGTEFLFGKLAAPEIGGQSFAIAALPVIIFFASLVSILYYLGVMQLVVRWVGGAIEKVVGTSKVESLCAAANIFVGQSESPLVIRPYLAGLTPPQLFTVMTSGMAGVAGTILAAYASMGIRIEYLLAASFMAAPGGILMAKIIMPDRSMPPKGNCRSATFPTPTARSRLPTIASAAPAPPRCCRKERRASRCPTPATTRKSPPTSSWPPPRGRRPACASPSRSARWCWRSSRSSPSPTGCSAGSATWSACPASASRPCSAMSSSR